MTETGMRPGAIVRFECALLLAPAIDLIANLLSWQAFAARFVAFGIDDPRPFVLASCLASPVIGLLLWYGVARRRSVVAKWVTIGLVAVGVAMLVNALAHPIAPGARTLLAAAAVSEALKVFAVVQLFGRETVAWFARERTSD